MKNVILILGILATVMVYGVVAGVSPTGGPDIDMSTIDADKCRICHDENQEYHHNTVYSGLDIKSPSCSDINDEKHCHTSPTKKIDCWDCHHEEPEEPTPDLLYVEDHHDELYYPCTDCHPQGQPKPL